MRRRTLSVLCADDTDIAVVGMRRILEQEPDIQVIGQATARDQVLWAVRELRPDVVLLDLNWGSAREAGCELITQIKSECPEVRVVAISVYEFLFAAARMAGADAVITKAVSPSDLIGAIRAVAQAQDVTSRAREQLVRLSKIPVGDRRAAADYEACILEILRLCFEPELTGWQAQTPSFGGTKQLDITCLNLSQTPFWAMIRQKYGGDQIVFEVKNVGALSREHVRQLSDYLGGPRGRIGFIVGRRTPSKSFSHAAQLLLEMQNHLVLTLTDDDFCQMAELKEQGQDPTEVLIRQYQELTQGHTDSGAPGLSGQDVSRSD